MLDEPYNSLVLLINISTAEYMFRVFGLTWERGLFVDQHELEAIIRRKFENTVACTGNPRLVSSTSAVKVLYIH